MMVQVLCCVRGCACVLIHVLDGKYGSEWGAGSTFVHHPEWVMRGRVDEERREQIARLCGGGQVDD